MNLADITDIDQEVIDRVEMAFAKAG